MYPCILVKSSCQDGLSKGEGIESVLHDFSDGSSSTINYVWEIDKMIRLGVKGESSVEGILNYILVGSISYSFISLGSLDQFRERKEKIVEKG